MDLKTISTRKEIKGFFGEEPIMAATIRVTKACNLRCPHCYVNAGEKLENELSLEEIKSIIDQLGTQAFYRLRVGIDHPKNSPIPEMLVEDYVLLPFRPEEKQIIDSTIDKILPELDEIISS